MRDADAFKQARRYMQWSPAIQPNYNPSFTNDHLNNDDDSPLSIYSSREQWKIIVYLLLVKSYGQSCIARLKARSCAPPGGAQRRRHIGHGLRRLMRSSASIRGEMDQHDRNAAITDKTQRQIEDGNGGGLYRPLRDLRPYLKERIRGS